MKKLLVCIVLSVFTFIGSQAQELHFGAKAGLNFASARGDDTDDLEGRTSFHLGGVLNIEITEELAIQPEIFYSGQGYSIKEDGGGDPTIEIGATDLERGAVNQGRAVLASNEDRVKIDYINVPVLLDYTVYPGLSLQAGPQIAFNVSSKSEFDGQEFDLKDQTKGTSISALLGAQYKLPLGIFFQARYALGLSNIPKDDDFEAKNAVFSISAGYFFN